MFDWMLLFDAEHIFPREWKAKAHEPAQISFRFSARRVEDKIENWMKPNFERRRISQGKFKTKNCCENKSEENEAPNK